MALRDDIAFWVNLGASATGIATGVSALRSSLRKKSPNDYIGPNCLT